MEERIEITCDILEDGKYYVEIPKYKGVWASGNSLAESLTELAEVLEEWLIIGKIKE